MACLFVSLKLRARDKKLRICFKFRSDFLYVYKQFYSLIWNSSNAFNDPVPSDIL